MLLHIGRILICAILVSTWHARLALAVPPSGERGDAYTMEQAVARALKANPSVESKLLALQRAKMDVGVAQSYFWPRVSLVAGANSIRNEEEVQTYNTDNLTSDNRNNGVRVSFSLFMGFAHLNNLQKARIAVDVEKARHQQARLELMANVQLQFLQLLKAREDLKSAEGAVARLETQLKASEAFFGEGLAPYANVLQNKTDLARARQQVIRSGNDIRNAEAQLNRYLGVPPDQRVRYLGDLKDFSAHVDYSEEEAVNAAMRQRPDLTVARLSVESAVKDMHITMGQFLPRLDVTYDHMRMHKDYDDPRYEDYTRKYWTTSLNFSWDIFSGGSAFFATQADRKHAQALRKDYEDAVAGARTDVIRSLLDIAAARELIATSHTAVDAARESYAMANGRYLSSIGTVTELLDAQQRLTQAENDASQALAEYHSARARFFHHIGRENPGLR